MIALVHAGEPGHDTPAARARAPASPGLSLRIASADPAGYCFRLEKSVRISAEE